MRPGVGIGTVAAIAAAVGCGRLDFDPVATPGPDAASCTPGGACRLTGLCLIGTETCDGDVQVCVADQPAGPGTSCVIGSCEPSGVCAGDGGTILIPAGAAAGDLSGYSVAVDGDWLVAGAPDSGVNGLAFAGAAFVYRRQLDGSWTEVQRLTAGDPGANDVFGNYVDVDGDRIMVGARWRGAADEGAVYAFEWNGQAWVQTDRITLPQPTMAIELGAAMDLDGDRAVVAADYGQVAGSYGSAYVLERRPDATWANVATLTSLAAERLGFSIDLDGDRVALGSLWDTGPSGLESGAVHVFERATDGTWAETATLWPPPPPAGGYSDAIGSAVAFDGDRLVAGDQLYDDGVNGTIGGVIVYERDLAGAWTAVAHLAEAAPSDGGELGRSLALAGDRLIASSVDYTTNAGRLSVFRRGGDSTWRQVARFTTPVIGGDSGYGLGGHVIDVKLAARGDEVFVGYPGIDNGSTANTGGIVRYDLTGL